MNGPLGGVVLTDTREAWRDTSPSSLSRLDLLLAGACFAVVAAAVFAASAWVIPFARWAEFDNVYFQSDIALVYANMTEFHSNHYRTGMHPLFSILMWPAVAVLKLLTQAPAEAIVRALLAGNAGTAAALAYVILLRVTADRLDALLYTTLMGVSASTMFWSTVPETFAFGGTTMLAMLALTTLPSRPGPVALILGSIATLSMTLTNGMVGLYATLRLSWPRWKRALRILACAGTAVLTLGLLAKVVMPSSGYVGDFRRYVAWVRAPHASDVRSFLAHSVVAPASIIRPRGDGALEVVNEPSAAGSGSAWGLAAVALWLALLAGGAAAALRRKDGPRAFRDVLLLSVGSQFVLHVTFADGPFLYAAHFAPMLVLLAAHASAWRWSRGLVVVTIAAVTWNNLVVFSDTTGRLEHELLPWLQAHGHPLPGTTAH